MELDLHLYNSTSYTLDINWSHTGKKTYRKIFCRTGSNVTMQIFCNTVVCQPHLLWLCQSSSFPAAGPFPCVSRLHLQRAVWSDGWGTRSIPSCIVGRLVWRSAYICSRKEANSMLKVMTQTLLITVSYPTLIYYVSRSENVVGGCEYSTCNTV